MSDSIVTIGMSEVVSYLRISARKFGLPIPIVNWQTDYYKESTIYIALVFIGEEEKRINFLDSELRQCKQNQKLLLTIKVRIDDALRGLLPSHVEV